MCDCEPSEYQCDTRPRARKEYRCEECNAVIAVGQQHLCMQYVLDGRWYISRICLGCEEAHHDVMHASGDNCWCVGTLYDEFHEWPVTDLTPALRGYGERRGLLPA